MKEALFYEPTETGRLMCTLCPKYCKLGDGQAGFCFIRKNVGGKMYSLGYGRPSAVHIDPIEKKPLFHFLPGTRILSLGTAGCNLGCKFCQNWEISKARAEQLGSVDLPPEAVVRAALRSQCPSIAYTYNEPTIFAEYVMDTSQLAHEHGLCTVMVTNGYVTQEALPKVYEHIDGANVDLKAFTNEFYRKITLSTLEPVLQALVRLQEVGVWVEITTLLIPTLNDSDGEIRELTRWVLTNLGDRVPMHFTAFHPDFKLLDLPATPPATVARARKIALELGAKFVYEGNVFSEGSNTYCPSCGKLLIRRSWHEVTENRLKDGRCSCGEAIPLFRPRVRQPA